VQVGISDFWKRTFTISLMLSYSPSVPNFEVLFSIFLKAARRMPFANTLPHPQIFFHFSLAGV
jgi:hypothetical protein